MNVNLILRMAILAVDPKNELAMENKAYILYLMDKHDESIKYCKKLIKMDSKSPSIQFGLSRTLYKLGLIPEALKAMSIASKLDPSLLDSKDSKMLQKLISKLDV